MERTYKTVWQAIREWVFGGIFLGGEGLYTKKDPLNCVREPFLIYVFYSLYGGTRNENRTRTDLRPRGFKYLSTSHDISSLGITVTENGLRRGAFIPVTPVL